jgi:hypothetical protein
VLNSAFYYYPIIASYIQRRMNWTIWSYPWFVATSTPSSLHICLILGKIKSLQDMKVRS